MKEFWDERFASEAYVYGTEPNVFLREQLVTLPTKGKALFLAEGEGRNAVYAAQKGWQTTAVDISEKGREKALKLASQKQVSIDYQISLLEDFNFEANKYDLIVLIYAHMPPANRVTIHKKCCEALNKGGYLLLEGFDKKQLGNKSGGPQNINLLYDLSSIKEDFSTLDLKIAESLSVQLNEGEFHKGEADIIRLLAKKEG